MGNLGMYQVVVTWMKKVGGPTKFLAIWGGGGAVIGGVTLKIVEKVANKIKRIYVDKKTATDAAIVHTVSKAGSSNEGLKFEIGNQFRVLEVDGDAALIEKIGDSNNPYFVSATFLRSISDYS